MLRWSCFSMNRFASFVIIFLCLTMGLLACQATRNRTGSVNGIAPAKEVSKLLKVGKVDEAAKLVVIEEEFFASSYGDPKVRAVVDNLTLALSNKYSPQLNEIIDRVQAINWPTSRNKWKSVRKELAQVHKRLDRFLGISPFQYSIYLPDAYGEAVTTLESKEAEIRMSASDVFSSYPLDDKLSFFELYPVPVDGGIVMRANQTYWKAALVEFSKEQSDTFFSLYGKYMPRSAKNVLGKKYFDSLCPAPEKADLKKILAAYKQVEAADMSLANIPGIKVAFLQVTNPDLIRKKTIDFPISIKVDVPFEASKASMIKMFKHKAVKEADIVVLVSVALAKVRRVVERNAKVKSTYVFGYEKVENPEYSIVKMELQAASEQYHDAQAGRTYTWGAALLEKLIVTDDKAEKIQSSKVRMDDLKEKLRSTSKYVDRPMYKPYHITKAHMDIYKYATVNYYVIDKRNKRYFRDTFDFSEKSFFTVCYDMQDSDKNKDKFLQTSVLEEDVVRHELEPVVVQLSDLLNQYVNTPSSWKQYASMMSIHRAIAADSQKAQEIFNADDYGFDKYADKRFDSVVLVRNLGLGLGTGFYVTDEMILTNYHVVEENEYVRLKLFDEREMMGRVIARDAHLDLALIQADLKGQPVCFYNKRELPLGAMVEIIGHPDDLQFSITRGALSSVRKHSPINYSVSKDKVLYIQTDAPVNGGNSGGPMFYGDYVIGVVDWGKMRIAGDRVAHGLNFAIHYSEVFKFLDNHGIDTCKGSK